MEGCPSGLHELLLYEASSATTGDPNVAGRPAPDAIKRRFQQPIYPSYPPSSFFVAPEEPPLSQGAHGCWEQPSDCAYALHLVSGQQRSESGGLLRECSQEFKQCSLAPAPAQRRMSCHSLTRRHHLTGAVDIFNSSGPTVVEGGAEQSSVGSTRHELSYDDMRPFLVGGDRERRDECRTNA